MNYRNTFIAISPDCPAKTGAPPPASGAKKTIARIEYEPAAKTPYTLTQEELIFRVQAEKRGITGADLKKRKKDLWDELFGKPHACLRASSLPKKYGRQIHFDENGKLALVSAGSEGSAADIRNSP